MNKKVYSKTQATCKVTFRLPKAFMDDAQQINLAGDFNNWDTRSAPMRKLKSGEFTISVSLEKDKEYQYRYLVNGNIWKNEENADKYVANNFNSENSVVVV